MKDFETLLSLKIACSVKSVAKQLFDNKNLTYCMFKTSIKKYIFCRFK